MTQLFVHHLVIHLACSQTVKLIALLIDCQTSFYCLLPVGSYVTPIILLAVTIVKDTTPKFDYLVINYSQN